MTQTQNELTDFLYGTVNFTPTDEQRVILESDRRFTLVAGGEQAGKSMIASKFLLKRKGIILASSCRLRQN
mgnify:CR=1 FL=1